MLADADDRLRALLSGGVCGAFAFLAGYAGTYAAALGRTGAAVADLGLAVDPPTWKAVGWVFYAAHRVRLRAPGDAGVRDLLRASDPLPQLLIGIPILSLLVFGLIAGRLVREDTARAGAWAGIATVAGYLPLALLGFGLFRVSTAAGVVAPDPLRTVLLAGLVFPALFGTLGGITGART